MKRRSCKNYFVAAGLNSIGILTGGGLGRCSAHWIINGRPDVDVTGFNIDRLHLYQANPEYRRTRTVESLGLVYQCHYPTVDADRARRQLPPLHDRLAAARRVFPGRERLGGRRLVLRRRRGTEESSICRGVVRTGSRTGRQSTRRRARGVIIMDMSFMSKFLVQGRDAGRLLNTSRPTTSTEPDGVITYTQWLNEDGKLEADLTVTKLDDDRFWVVATDTAHRHVETWMRRTSPDDAHALRHRRDVRLRADQRSGPALARADADR